MLELAANDPRFFSHDESDKRQFHRVMDEFKSRIPDLAQSLSEQITEAHDKNRKFKWCA